MDSNKKKEEKGKGVGRGRGWLQLKNENSYLKEMTDMVFAQLETMTAFVPCDPKATVARLISIVNQMNMDIQYDDLGGAVYKLWTDEWDQSCNTEDDLKVCVDLLHDHALTDAVFAIKYSRYFAMDTVNGEPRRRYMIMRTQHHQENIAAILGANREHGRNALLLFCCWYVLVGQKTLIRGMFGYVDRFMKHQPDEADVRLMAKMLPWVVRKWRKSAGKGECIENYLVVLKEAIADSDRLGSTGRLWFLLALELCHVSPSDKHRNERLAYYQHRLGVHDVAFLKLLDNDLDITWAYYFTTPGICKAKSQLTFRSEPEPDPETRSDPQSETQNDTQPQPQTQPQTQPQSQLQTQNQTQHPVEPFAATAGRPILGAGARLLKARDPDSVPHASEADENRD